MIIISIIIVCMEDILTQREKEVLRLAALGYSNEEIGLKLFISSHTVKYHLENIYRKFKTHNRIQTTVFAIKLGILTL